MSKRTSFAVSIYGLASPASAGSPEIRTAGIHTPGKRRFRRWAVYFGTAAALAFVAAAVGFAAVRYWPRKLPDQQIRPLETISMAGSRAMVILPGYKLVGDLSSFEDPFFAYLMYDHFRSQPALQNRNVMLVSDDDGPRTIYRILLELPGELITATDELSALKSDGLTSQLDCNWATTQVVEHYLAESKVFTLAFQSPAQRSFERLHGPELHAYVRRFIRFKSVTDPRIRQSSGTIPSPLTRKQADRLAADIIAVAKFYEIPLDLMIGIGAMENNFMSVPGDLSNTKWKRRAQPGDIVLRRARGRVLVRNDSSGVWQITRESLRYAQKLFLRDKRDYTQLPERLRPQRKLQLADMTDDVLTTYAGLLLRDLLDRFHGDVLLAAGAYNGSVDHPNPKYAEGVQAVASYARNVIERAVELNDTTLPGDSGTEQPATGISPAPDGQ